MNSPKDYGDFTIRSLRRSVRGSGGLITLETSALTRSLCSIRVRGGPPNTAISPPPRCAIVCKQRRPLKNWRCVKEIRSSVLPAR